MSVSLPARLKGSGSFEGETRFQIGDSGTRVCTSRSGQDGLGSAGVPLLAAQTGEDVSGSSSFHELDDLHTRVVFGILDDSFWAGRG